MKVFTGKQAAVGCLVVMAAGFVAEAGRLSRADKRELIRRLGCGERALPGWLYTAESIHQRDAVGWTPLMFAAADGNIEVLRLILAAGSPDLDATGHGGETAVALAASNGRVKALRFLLEAGADPNAGRWRSQPERRKWIADFPEAVGLLRQYGAQW